MVTAVNICNIALQNIGANAISNLTENSNEAIACNLRYETIRAAVLEAHPWNFSITRASLNKLTASPAFGYGNQFGLPSDFLRIVASEEQVDFIDFGSNFNGYVTISNQSSFAKADNYKIEMVSATGVKVLLSDDSAKNIIYVFDQKDTSKFPPLFIEMLAKGLGAAIAYRITNNRALKDQEQKDFDSMLDNTKLTDAQQGTYERTESSSFIGARQ